MAFDQDIPDNQEPKPQQPPSFDEFEDKISSSLKIPRNLIKSLTTQESGGNPDAQSSKGASGRWQVMPATFEETKKRLGRTDLTPDNPYDNIYVGAHYLKGLYDSAPKDLPNEGSRWAYALSKYHGGGMDANGNVRAVSDGGTTTDKYVDTIMNRWRSLNQAGQQQEPTQAQGLQQPQVKPQQSVNPINDLNKGRTGNNGEFILQGGETTKNDQLADNTPANPVQGTVGPATRGMLARQGRVRPSTDVELANPGANKLTVSIPGEAGVLPTQAQALHQVMRSLGAPQGFEELYQNPGNENPLGTQFTPENLAALQKAGYLRFDPESKQYQLDVVAPNSLKAMMDNYTKQQTDLNAVSNPSWLQTARQFAGGMLEGSEDSLGGLIKSNPNVGAALESAGSGLAKTASNIGNLAMLRNPQTAPENRLDRVANTLGQDAATVGELDPSLLGRLNRGLISGAITMPMINELAHAGGLPAVLANGVLGRAHLSKEDQLKGIINDIATVKAMQAAGEMPGIVQAGIGGAAQVLGRTGTGDVKDIQGAVPAFLEGMAMSPAARQRRGIEPSPSITAPEGVRNVNGTEVMPISDAAQVARQPQEQTSPVTSPVTSPETSPVAQPAAASDGVMASQRQRRSKLAQAVAPQEGAGTLEQMVNARQGAPVQESAPSTNAEQSAKVNKGVEIFDPSTEVGWEDGTKIRTHNVDGKDVIIRFPKGMDVTTAKILAEQQVRKGAQGGQTNPEPIQGEPRTAEAPATPETNAQTAKSTEQPPIRPAEPPVESGSRNLAEGQVVPNEAERVTNAPEQATAFDKAEQSGTLAENAPREAVKPAAPVETGAKNGVEARPAEEAPANVSRSSNVPTDEARQSRPSDVYSRHGIELAPEVAEGIDNRHATREGAEKGSLGKLGSIGRSGIIPAGEDKPLRSFAEHPALRKMLGLPEIPPEVYEKSSADWGKMTQHTMDALAEKAGVPRSSKMDDAALGNVEKFLAENYDANNPEHRDLDRVFAETRAAVDMAHNKVDALFESEPFKTALQNAQVKLDAPNGHLRGKARTALIEELDKIADRINQDESLGRVEGKSNPDITSLTPNAIKGLVKDLKDGKLSGQPGEWLGRRFKEHLEGRNSESSRRPVSSEVSEGGTTSTTPKERPAPRTRRTPVAERSQSPESGSRNAAETSASDRGNNAERPQQGRGVASEEQGANRTASDKKRQDNVSLQNPDAPQVARPTMVRRNVTIDTPNGAVKGHRYLVPSLEGFDLVVEPPGGSKSKSNKHGYRIYEGKTGTLLGAGSEERAGLEAESLDSVIGRLKKNIAAIGGKDAFEKKLIEQATARGVKFTNEPNNSQSGPVRDVSSTDRFDNSEVSPNKPSGANENKAQTGTASSDATSVSPEERLSRRITLGKQQGEPESGGHTLGSNLGNAFDKFNRADIGKILDHLKTHGENFVSWAKAMIQDFGASIRPKLREIYNQGRAFLADQRGSLSADGSPLPSQEELTKQAKGKKGQEKIGLPADFDIRKYAKEADGILKDATLNDKKKAKVQELFGKALDAVEAGDGAALVKAQAELKEELKNSKWMKASDFMRPLNATGEFSPVGRQGWIGWITHPKVSVDAFKAATGSEDGAMRFLAKQLNRPNMGLMKQAGLDLGMLNEINLSKSALSREEGTLSRWPEKIPIAGKALGFIERFNKTFLEGQRIGLFDAYQKAAESRGAQMWEADADGKPVPSKAAKQIAKQINIITGRGDIPDNKIAQAIVDLGSVVAYSPRFAISRFQAADPTRLYRVYKQSPEVFKSVAGDYAKQLVAYTAMAGALKAAGFQVSLTNPDDPDFLKAKIGNFRVPIVQGGLQPAVRFAAKMAKRGYEIASGSGDKGRGGALTKAGSDVQSFLRQKEAPLAGFLHDQVLARKDVTDAATQEKVNIGTNAIGQPVSAGRDFAQHILPMYFLQTIESYQNGGPAVGAATGGLELFGLSSGYYDSGKYGENQEEGLGKTKIKRDWSYARSGYAPWNEGMEPLDRYHTRVERADKLYNEQLPALRQTSYYQNADKETQRKMETTLTNRIQDLSYDENPNKSKISPSAIIASIQAGAKRQETTRKKNSRKSF